MHIMNQSVLGAGMLLMLGALVIIKYLTTGSIFDKPKGNFLLQFVNIYNLFFLLIVSPLSSVLLITKQVETMDPTHLNIQIQQIVIGLEVVGGLFYVLGYILMSWALIELRDNYQLGGSEPRRSDELVSIGPYRFVRHPMYAAVLFISLGLSFLVQSVICIIVFCVYLILILLLIAFEEKGLRNVYGSHYSSYQKNVKKLIPFIY